MSGAISLIGREGFRKSHRVVRERGDGQMFLDLPSVPSRKIFIIAMDEVHGGSLRSLIACTPNSLVVDLRHVLRFDLPSMNRSSFFDSISRASAEYVRIPIRWHELSFGPLVTDSNLPAQLKDEVMRKSRGYILVLVPKEPHARHVASAMNFTLRSAGHEDWEIN